MDELIDQAPKIIAIIAGIIALFVAWSNVKKNRATAKKTIAEATNEAVDNLIDVFKERIEQLEAKDKAKDLRIEQLQSEGKTNSLRSDQFEKALEDLTFEHYKLYLLVVILTDQLEESGIPPLVRLEKLAAWDSDDLVAIAKDRDIKLPKGVRHYRR